MISLRKTVTENLSKTGYLAYVFLLIAVLLLALYNPYMPPFIIATLIFWFLEFVSRDMKIAEGDKKTRLLLYLFLGLNIVFLTGLFSSDDLHNGFVLYFRRLSLLLFPIILFSPGDDIRKRIHILLKAFVAGLLIFMVICLSFAMYRSVTITGGIWSFNPYHNNEFWSNYFFGQLLSINQHPSYIAMYSVVAMFISLDFSWQKSISRRIRVAWLFAAISMLVFIYLLSSRASFLAILIILPAFLWIKLNLQRNKVFAVISLIILVGLFAIAILKNQRVSLYFDKSIDPAILNDGRFDIWRSALKVVEQHPVLGAGIGDYYKAMDKAFISSGYSVGYYKDFNAHNQYLEILCISGISGFVLFVLILGFMIYYAVKDRNLLYGVFIMNMLIFFSVESILSRFAGNSFFALFTFLLIHYKSNIGQEAVNQRTNLN